MGEVVFVSAGCLGALAVACWIANRCGRAAGRDRAMIWHMQADLQARRDERNRRG